MKNFLTISWFGIKEPFKKSTYIVLFVIFVLNYRWYFVVGITLLMLMEIYLTARKINKVCTSC